MKDNLKIIGVLTGVCMLCGFVLAFVFSSAKDRIEQNQKDYIRRAIYNLAPQAESVKEEQKKDSLVYFLSDSSGNDLGYAFLCEGLGYQGPIKILFAADKKLKTILGIEIIESNETPGLGAKINEPEFKIMFSGVPVSRRLEVVKTAAEKKNEIQAITSATVSSKAVVRIVNAGIDKLKEVLE